ncbi:MAG: c-type cytochrome [Burkholderiaceae bacterium]|jgi:sulfide dehydrogenase cytochrome subunit|nr:c-type cytochrome [Burkholderiaceae bacterium]MEB2350154.1 c-type cytochrome [Burkholderiaceae bacterium]
MRKTALGAALLLAGAAWAGGAAAQGVPVSVLAGNCVGCHGIDGVSGGPATPSIAGMSKVYFVNAMLSYKYGKDLEKIEAAAKKLKIDPDDVEGHERLATVMDRMAKGYSDEEIGALADYFAGKRHVAAIQPYNAALVARGKRVHDDACEKCHEDGGRKGDGAGVLAGQWMPYLNHSIMDFNAGHRGMPKKMRANMKDLTDKDFEALVQFYASQK